MPRAGCATPSMASARGTRASRARRWRSFSPRCRVPDTKTVQYRVIDRTAPDRGGERERVVAGLMASPAVIEPRYFYDDLGAGDCCKAQSWLPFVAPARYLAVDIAGAEIERALARMAPDFPEVEMV